MTPTTPTQQESSHPKVVGADPSKRGHWFGAISIVLALASVAVAPVVLGPLGILTGMVAVTKGDRHLGMLGVTASAVLGVTGYYLAGAILE